MNVLFKNGFDFNTFFRRKIISYILDNNFLIIAAFRGVRLSFMCTLTDFIKTNPKQCARCSALAIMNR